MDSQIKLLSSDGKEESISKSALTKHKYFSNALQGSQSELKLNDVNSETLKLVVEYLNHYATTEASAIPAVLKSNDLKSELKSDWDFNFIDAVSFEQGFHLINAGALLELDHLHDLACAKIAAFMKDKNTEDVNKEFTIECQLTAEEAKNLGLEVDDNQA